MGRSFTVIEPPNAEYTAARMRDVFVARPGGDAKTARQTAECLVDEVEVLLLLLLLLLLSSLIDCTGSRRQPSNGWRAIP